ncbi:T9SS type A sorting domain-containing protein, partial [candidate division WOR-3 bacterium]|nr:T9SS type A sorting domain-containing protein [candidate division WOR-3 bacterium]
DVKTDSFAFFMSSRDTGWSARAPLPGLPSGKAAKNGAWLAHDFGTGFIYAAKGNKTPDFYAYSPVADSWRQLAAMPPGREGKAPGNGATGCADGAGTVYAAKGNNSLGFYRYVAARDSWHQLADVPPGLSGKRVKGGTDAVFVSSTTAGFVYLLKGHKNEFYRYDPVSDSWQTLAAAPAEKWGRGSWLAHMPEGRGSSARAPVPGTDFETGICESGSFTAGVIYAHQAKHHGMYAYDIEAGTWGSNLGGMPSVGRSGRSKMSKDGGSSATLGPAIYAFKGNNSQEFWRFLAPVGPWTELDTLPMTAPGSLKKKKVKAGADLVGYGPWDVLYGLKGNATYEFWCYTPAASTTSAAGMVQSGVTAIGLGSSATRVMTVSPNPLKARIAAIHLNPRFPESSIPVVSIFDAGGRLVRRSVFSTRQSSVTLDLSGLTAGVYLLRLEAGGVAWSEKLVLQR